MSDEPIVKAEATIDAEPTLVDKLKAQAPTAATSAIVAVVAVLIFGGKTAAPPDVPTLPDLPVKPADLEKPTAPPRRSPNGLESRLVSCGDSMVAKVAGDDTAGLIALGPGAAGACTLLFSAPWSGVPTCAVNGGTVASVTANELVIAGAGDAVSYRCGGE